MGMEPVTLITHVRHYIGPAAVKRLLREDMTVVCHDRAFADPQARAAFAAEMPGAAVVAATEPAGIAAEVEERFGRLDALVSNDPYPGDPRAGRRS